MRELQDYFCTYEQREELNKLGLNEEEHEVVCEYYVSKGIPFAGILCSQALDFFRDLGWEIHITNDNYGIIVDSKWVPSKYFDNPKELENSLISRLIELEKEARNGN